jgi:hypothetical protein
MKPPPGFAPLDAPDAAHGGVNRPSQHIEAHHIADTDAEALHDGFFDRHFSRLRKPPLDQRFVGLELAAVGDRVLTRQHPATLEILHLLQIDAFARHPRAQHRDQTRLRVGRQPF